MSVDWALIWQIGDVFLVVVLLVGVAIGTIPVLSTALQFLVLPFAAFINHYRRAAPTWPHVAVIIPAWNEGLVVGSSIDRMLSLEYPEDRLRIFVVDDASTDDTPDVVLRKAAEHPGRVFHLRRALGGEGKAHTLNHGIERVLAEPWAEAILIMDADVIFARDSLRKMTRHFADPRVGAVTAFIAEGSRDRNSLTRFIGLEYVIAQLAARRAQSTMGAVACLAGGAQLHSRENLEAIGGRIPTGTLAEDTMATFESQFHGRRMIFEPTAVVFAEEPRTIDALWKQRLRWARGNVQVTKHYHSIWFRPSKQHRLGGFAFGSIWFSVLLLPVMMVVASVSLILLLLLHSDISTTVFRVMWIAATCVYLYSMAYSLLLDRRMAASSWLQAIFFPGAGSLVVMAIALFPHLMDELMLDPLGVAPGSFARDVWLVALYSWGPIAMAGAWFARSIERTRVGSLVAMILLYIVGYGALLCAITVDSYVKEWRRADTTWVKTEKVGRVFG